MKTKFTMPPKFNPINLKPGDIDFGFTEEVNRERRNRSVAEAVYLLRWAILLTVSGAIAVGAFITYLIA